VLREVVSLQTGRPRPALSTLFGPEPRVTDTELSPKLTGDVSRLGARPAPSGWRRRRAAAGASWDGGVPPDSAPVGGAPVFGPPAAATAAPGTTAGVPAPAGTAGNNGFNAVPPGASGSVAAQGTAGHFGGAANVFGGPAPDGTPGLVRPIAVPAVALALPLPHVDPGDPGAGLLAGLLASAPGELISALAAAPQQSPEIRLRQVRARLENGDFESALALLTELAGERPDDWRVVWYRGVAALVTGDFEEAALAFDAVYDAFPGEAAPKLALGLCAEILGQTDNAAEYYHLVWSTDPSFVSAAFGLARVQLSAVDRGGAVRTLESVPESSIHYTAARTAAVRARLRQRTASASDMAFLEDLMAAAAQVEALDAYGLDPGRREQLSAEVLGCALDWILSGGQASARPAVGGRVLLGSELDERGLRFGLERSYRTLARLAPGGEERIDLVERANRYRPRTWV
jgi:serine/threonine-protein kinase PknG